MKIEPQEINEQQTAKAVCKNRSGSSKSNIRLKVTFDLSFICYIYEPKTKKDD